MSPNWLVNITDWTVFWFIYLVLLWQREEYKTTRHHLLYSTGSVEKMGHMPCAIQDIYTPFSESEFIFFPSCLLRRWPLRSLFFGDSRCGVYWKLSPKEPDLWFVVCESGGPAQEPQAESELLLAHPSDGQSSRRSVNQPTKTSIRAGCHSASEPARATRQIFS